ncbi:RNase H [Paramecium bursaria Chlorella virus KS1B]|nr:RNase H [Paramecium bursaria Chlorella virus KS1B]
MNIHIPYEKNVGRVQPLRGFPNIVHFGNTVKIVYTDASIRQKKGGIGICSRSSVTDFEQWDTFRASVNETKDINRNELGAIFASISMTDIYSDIVIYSDSLTSINNIVNRTKRNKYDKLSSFTLQLVKERKGNVYISKVKAHSGNIGNTFADKLAKDGSESIYEFVMPDEFSSIDEWVKYNNSSCSSSVMCMLR